MSLTEVMRLACTDASMVLSSDTSSARESSGACAARSPEGSPERSRRRRTCKCLNLAPFFLSWKLSLLLLLNNS
jgi:hypothetical protein